MSRGPGVEVPREGQLRLQHGRLRGRRGAGRRRPVPRARLCGNQPVSEVIVSLHAIEPTQSRGQHRVDGVESPRHRADAATEARRVDGVGRPKFDFHTAPNAMSATNPCATTSKPAALLIATPATAAPRAGVNALVVPSAAATTRIWERPFFIFLLLVQFRVLQRFLAVRWCSGVLLQRCCVGAASAARRGLDSESCFAMTSWRF